MNDKCPLCGVSVNEDRDETGEVLLSANESGGALEGLLREAVILTNMHDLFDHFMALGQR